MSEQRGGELQVSISRAERGGRPGVEAAIADTGPGVSAELREQIFNPFVTTKKAGVGLGLSIVSKIVDEHHGSIELAGGSSGACFIIFFPFSEKGAVGRGRLPLPAPAGPESALADRRAVR